MTAQLSTVQALLQLVLELSRAAQVQSRHYEGLAFGLCGVLKNALGDSQGVISDCAVALRPVKALELTRGQLLVHQELSRLYETNGDHVLALLHYKCSHELKRRVLAGRAEQHVRAIGARFEAEAVQRATHELEQAYAKLRE